MSHRGVVVACASSIVMILAALKVDGQSPATPVPMSGSGNATSSLDLRQYGVKGDGVADDTAALQAAVDATPSGGRLFLPCGMYKLSASIASTAPILITGCNAAWGNGVQGTVIFGNFNDYLIKFNNRGIWGGSGVEDISLKNSSTAGGGIFATNLAGSRFSHLRINAYRGITLASNVFSVLIQHISIAGSLASGGWGIYTRGHTQIVSADIAGCDHGIRATGDGVSIVGGRYEVNTYAIVLGLNDAGEVWGMSGVSLSGISMEANDYGIWVKAAASWSITGVKVAGTQNAPSRQSKVGILVDTTNVGAISSVNIAGNFTTASIRSAGHVTFENALISANALGPRWDVRDLTSTVFINSDYDPRADGVAANNVTTMQFVRAIGAADQVRGEKQGKNLRGINVIITSGSIFVDIAFPSHAAGNAAISTATVVNDPGSTLPANTYHYVGTIVNEVGETKAIGVVPKEALVSVSQRVDMTFVAVAGKNWRRRIYRGRASGVYDGYFELPLESSAVFSDSGQTFTARRSGTVTEGAQGTEPDAMYAVVVSTAWNTTTWITGKSPKGFRVNFGTAPGQDSALDWVIIR